MIKLQIGGSPCTKWSIAQTNGRETLPEGIGWELFENYLIAKGKFKPGFFLYENNKSASQAIKDQIKKELGVWDETLLMEDTGARYIEINSALVSAQSRQRFYVHNCGDVGQPKDRGILLRDILISGECDHEKARCVTSSVGRTTYREYFRKQQNTMCFERCGSFPLNATRDGKSRTIKAQYGKTGTVNSGACTGLYAIPICGLKSGKGRCVQSGYAHKGVKHILDSSYSDNPNKQTRDCCAQYLDGYYATAVEWSKEGKPIKAQSTVDGKIYHVYEVINRKVTIKDKQYPLGLDDGFYIIRKLTPVECERLQTLPDGYTAAVSDTQRYKGIGNGWTAEVIIHIMNGALKDVPRDEKIVVLSMYDGIGTGRYCLDKMGFTNVEYHAYEIDKYAIKVAMSNYPDIIQHGDAFSVRKQDWRL